MTITRQSFPFNFNKSGVRAGKGIEKLEVAGAFLSISTEILSFELLNLILLNFFSCPNINSIVFGDLIKTS